MNAVIHVEAHLLVGYGFARHGQTSIGRTKVSILPARSNQHRRHHPDEDDRAAACNLRSGYALPSVAGSGQLGCRYRPTWLSLITSWWRWTVDDEEIASIRLVAESKREVEIVKRPREASGFVLLPRRWVVERSFAWFGRNRRLYKDCECHLRTALACLYIASVNMLLRRCATY